MIDKRRTMEEVVELVKSDDMLALGGLTLYRRPMSFIRALLRHSFITGEPKNLTLLTFTAGLESDLLVGAEIVTRVRTCYFGLEIFGLAPMFTYFANRGKIEILEETEASIAFGLRAQMAGVGFMPGRGWLGTDLPKLRPDVKKIIDPYTNEELIAFPAIKPDIAIIHALKSDVEGNAQIGDNKSIDEELLMTASKVIITAEKVVPELYKADLVAPLVHAVVEAPKGAEPTSCHPLYGVNGEEILAYTEQVSDPDSWRIYVDKMLGSEL
ncbi:MAG: CoA-transferase [Anaerolineales bacterium]